ncbi:MAG: hypothetical protein P8X42_09510 [Calditrichaceae bacterium]|jgi:hypothetical protein
MNRNFTFLTVIFLVLSFSINARAQLKKDTDKPNISSVLTMPDNNFLLGFLDPSKIDMHHSFSMSYTGFGGQGMMLNTYMNTIDFQLSKNLLLETNIGLMNSPYNSFGEDFYLNDTKLFGGARLKYNINEKSSLQLQFDYSPYYYPYQTLGSYRFNNFDN